MFIFQVMVPASRTAEQLLGEFKQNAEQARKKIDKGEQPKTAFYDVELVYGRALMSASGMRPAQRNEFLKSVEIEYGGLLLYYGTISNNAFVNNAPSSAQAKPMEAVTAENKALMAKFATDIASVALRTSPLQFYGASSSLNYPVWYEELANNYTKLTNSSKGYGDEGFKKALKEQLANNGLKENQIKIILGMFEGKENGAQSFSAAAETMTRTQKALDGISLLIKKNKLGYEALDVTQMQHFFPDAYEKPDRASPGSLYNRLQSGKDMGKAIEELFGEIAKNGNRQMMQLVVDANFGENASALKSVINGMARSDGSKGKMQADFYKEATGSSLENLSQFYKNLLATWPGANGLNSPDVQRAWRDMKGAGNFTNELLGGSQQVTQDGMIRRGKYDISVIMGFLQATESQDYFKSDAFKGKTEIKGADGKVTYQDNAVQYLEAITLNGTAPSAVALSLLANAKTVDYVYKNFKKNPQDIIDITREMARTAATIYNQPVGGTFDAVKGTKPQTRQEAVEWFLDRVRTLKSNTLIDDIKQRYLDLGYREDEAYIKLRSLYELALIGGYDIDSDDIRGFLNSLSTRPTNWNNATDAYNAVKEYVNNRPYMTWHVVEDFYANLMKSPQAYMNSMSILLEEVLPKDIRMRLNQYGASASGGGYGQFDTDSRQTDVLNVQGQMGTSTGSGTAGYAHDITRSDIDNTSLDSIRREAWLQSQNLYASQMRLYETFARWLDSKITTTTSDPASQIKLEEITDTKEIDARMRAGGFGGNLFISFEQRGDKSSTNGATTRDVGKTHIEAIYVRDGHYFKIIGLDKYSTEIDKLFGEKVRAQRFVAEHSQWALPFGSFAVGEVEKRPKVASLTELFTGCVDAAAVQAEFATRGITLAAGNLSTISSMQAGNILMIEQDGKNYEVRRNNDGKYNVFSATMSPRADNFGFVLAAQTQSETLAGLYAQTVQNDRFAMAAVKGNVDKKKFSLGGAKQATSKISKGKPYQFVEDFAGIVAITEEQKKKIVGLKVGDSLEAGEFLIKRERKQYAVYRLDKPVSGFVVSAGYMQYSQEQTDMFNQKSKIYNYGDRYNISRPKHAIGIVSLLTDRMYATVMGNDEFALGKVEASGTKIGSFGAGGFMKWASDGPKVYMFNGMHSIKNVISTRLAVESIEDEFKRISGRSTINVGKAGYRIHLYGSDMPEITSQPIQDRWNNQHAAVLNEIYELTQEINGLNAASDKGKAAKAAELGTRMLGLLEQLYRLRTGDAFNNTVNQFSVGIEAPDGSFTKISLANTKTVISADGGATTETKDALYILNMTSIGFGNSKAVTFTAGIPVSKIGEGELKNLAGVKLNMGDLAFGVAAYDLDFKKGISGARYDFAWVNPSYTKSLVRGAGVGLTQMKGGWSGDLTVGFKIGDDVIASVKVTKTQMKGVLSPAGAVSSQVGQDDINAYSLATDVAINTSTGMTWVLSGAYHHAKQEDLKADQVTARATLADRRGLSGSFYFDTRRFNAPGGNAYDYNVGLTVRKNIF